MQGWRISMEDAHTTVLDLLPTAKRGDADKSHPENLAFFGVYDGHGGDKVAIFSGEHIPSILLKQDTFKSQDYAQSLKDTFLATDRAILNGTPFYQLLLPNTTLSTHLKRSIAPPNMRPVANARFVQTPDMRRRYQAALLV